MTADADVVVVGAGPVGSALAMMLGRSGLKTVLLDRARFPRDKPCGEGLLPAGVQVLDELGVPLGCFPPVAGVTYRVPGTGRVDGNFAKGAVGRGTRRLAFDQLLAGIAAATPNVTVALGCEARGLVVGPELVTAKTTAGEIRARFLVGADGRRSQVARWMGWWRAPRPAHRFALVGHLDAPGHGFDRIVVTLLEDCEVYLAPTSPKELLVALLGSKQGLRGEDEPAREAYARRVAKAHPELAGCDQQGILGAGPFWLRPSSIAAGGVFLAGDAAGFLDPLTGDGMTAGLLAARALSRLLSTGCGRPAESYRRWEAAQWRRRLFMGRLALMLSGSSVLARRAIRGLTRHPATLDRLLEVNDGGRSPLSLSAGDWAALAGI